jgi:single-stranded-DNA-specific exonuclease
MLRILRREPDAQRVRRLGALPGVLARAYAARGVDDPAELSGGLDRLLPVGTLEGVDAAVALLLEHREPGRSVLVIGDFDADGATSTALMVRAMRGWGFAAVDFMVPNRFQFGYGLTPGIVELAAARQPSLIVTVDNGISSLAGVEAARSRGIAVLVTDHHLPGPDLPGANVIVNPNLPASSFGSKSLAGVGVAFYVMAALHRALRSSGLLEPAAAPSPADLLDLVALGTVADLVPLDGNNRVLVAQGLRRIRAGRCTPGIRALLEAGRRAIPSVTATDLGFTAAPRLNAAGRIDDMSVGIRCLLADTPAEAQALAARLEELNAERREIEGRMQAQALAAVRHLKALDDEDGDPRRYGLCLYDADWHQGVVGLVASRVKDRMRRPVVAFANAGDGELRGSARSVPGVHVRDVLEAIATRHPGLIERFGGHAMAAGLTLPAGGLDLFASEFDAEVRRWQRDGSRADCIETDGALGVDEISLRTAELLREAGPWGQAFPEPSFDQPFTIRRSRVVGDNHLKMWVEVPGSGRSFDAIAFNYFLGRAAGVVPEAAHLVYRLDVNEYGGERRLQLLVDHVLP